jgi:hypothetical protein
MSLDPDFVEKLSGTLGNVLKSHLEAEQSPATGNDMALDVFINDFEDEFPRDPDDPLLGSYPTYSEEAGRAAREEPYGLKRGDRPKVWELNQPPPARVRGWRVVDLYPNREVKSEFYRLAGTPSEIRMMAQLIRHTQELVKKFGSGSVKFEEWFKQWADGWDSLTNRTNAELNLTTNYPAIDSTKIDPATGVSTAVERWRTPTTKPGYIEWKDSLGKGLDGYKVIEYFPNKNEVTTSVIFSGSDADIINHIVRYHSSAQGVAVQAVNEPKLTGSTSFKGLPKVKLYFYEDPETVDAAYSPIRAELSFRIVGKTERHDLVDNGQTDLDKLTTADVKAISNRIIEQFARPTPYKIHKGKATIKYLNKRQGIESWTHVMSKPDGREIYTRLCAVVGVKMNRGRLSYSELDDPLSEFPTIPPRMSILGQEFRSRRRRPSGYVYFSYSVLELESLSYPIILTNNKTVVFEESKLQEAQSGSGIQF